MIQLDASSAAYLYRHEPLTLFKHLASLASWLGFVTALCIIQLYAKSDSSSGGGKIDDTANLWLEVSH